MSDPVQKSGLFVSLRRLLATVLEIVQVRLELLGTEIELEKRRLFDGLLWGAVALLVLGLGLALLCGFVVLLFWDGYRVAAAGVMALIFLVASGLLMREARRRLHSPTGLINTSVSELKRDLAGLKASDQNEQR